MSNVKNWHDDFGIDEINDECFQCQVVNDEGTTVATAFGKTADECNENSKLIAAAPSMLEALEILIKEFSNYEDFTLNQDSAIWNAKEVINKVKVVS